MSTVLLLGFCYSIATLGEAGGFPYKSPRWSMTDGRVNAVITLQTTMMVTERLQIAAVVAAKRLPTVYGYREHVDAGALISQGGRSALVQVPGRELRTQNPYRHPAERASHPARNGREPQGREGNRVEHPRDIPGARGRGN